jgi:enoyl-CoA hydratase
MQGIHVEPDWAGLPGVARLVIRHAPKRNALSRGMWLALHEAAVALAAQAHRGSLRLVILQGEGEHFCAGGDIAEYESFRFQADTLAHFHEREVWPALQALLDLPVPLVAAIDGACMGAGLELACCADLRWATERARFGAPIAQLGFGMAPREAALVHSRLGDAWARRILLAAEKVDAVALATSGFVQVAWPAAGAEGLPQPDEAAGLQHAVRTACEGLLQLSPLAARLHKQQLRGAMQADTDAGAYDWAGHPEHREGIAAFVQRRRPQF